MKSIYLIFALICLTSTFSFAAPTDTNKVSLKEKTAALLMIDDAKKDFYEGYTRTAIVKFRQALLKDPKNATAAFWVSKCHNQFKNYGYALSYAKDALSIDENVDAEVYFIIADAYHKMNNLNQAVTYYKKCEDEISNYGVKALRIEERIKECERFLKDSAEVKGEISKILLPKKINSGFDDYAPVLSKNGKQLYFVSRRLDTKGGGINPDDQRFYEDIYLTPWEKNLDEYDSVGNELDMLNSIGFDAISAFNNNASAAYITLNTSTVEVGRDFTTKGSDIAVSRKDENGKWAKPMMIDDANINTSFFEGSATIDKFANTMIFVSDRNGMNSKSDLYISKKEDAKWGRAVALPDNVNTDQNETTPYLTPDGNYLFFSSNGRDGYGDYDIYVCRNKGGNEWTDPVNLGPQINSVTSDTHFQYYPEFGVAFCSTIRLEGEKSSMDIYMIDLEGMAKTLLPK